jgi:hypothetical protein
MTWTCHFPMACIRGLYSGAAPGRLSRQTMLSKVILSAEPLMSPTEHGDPQRLPDEKLWIA